MFDIQNQWLRSQQIFCGEFSPLPNEDIRETGKELITDNEYGVSDSWDNQYNGETIY